MASTSPLGSWDGRLPANVGVLWEESVLWQRSVFLRVRRTMVLEPGDRSGDAFLERHRGLVAEQLACLRQIGDVVRDLTEQRRCQRDLRLDPELRRDQLRR